MERYEAKRIASAYRAMVSADVHAEAVRRAAWEQELFSEGSRPLGEIEAEIRRENAKYLNEAEKLEMEGK